MPNDYCPYNLPSKSFHVYWGRPFSSIWSSVPSWTSYWNCFFFTVFSEMQFTSCPVYYAPSSSPLMVSLHLHNLSESLPLFSTPSYTFTGSLVLCSFFFFFLSSLKAIGIIPVLLFIHYFNNVHWALFLCNNIATNEKVCASWIYTMYKKCI